MARFLADGRPRDICLHCGKAIRKKQPDKLVWIQFVPDGVFHARQVVWVKGYGYAPWQRREHRTMCGQIVS